MACTGPQLSAVRGLSKITKSDCQLRHDCLCVRPHGTTVLFALDGFLKKFVIFRESVEKFIYDKTCYVMSCYVTSLFTSRHVILYYIIYTVCLPHVSATLVSILRQVHYKRYSRITKFTAQMSAAEF